MNLRRLQKIKLMETLAELRGRALRLGVNAALVRGHPRHKSTWLAAITAAESNDRSPAALTSSRPAAQDAKTTNWLPSLVRSREVKVLTLRVPDVLTGYRHEPSLRQCALSLFQLHNETLNIWVHLIGIAFYGAQLWKVFFTPAALWTSVDAAGGGVAVRSPWAVGERRVFALHCAANCAVFTCSVMYHWFCSLGAIARDRFLMLDLLGIVAMIAGEFVSFLLLCFVCAPETRFFYCAVTALPLTAMLGAPLYPKKARNILLVATSGEFLPFSV